MTPPAMAQGSRPRLFAGGCLALALVFLVSASARPALEVPEGAWPLEPEEIMAAVPGGDSGAARPRVGGAGGDRSSEREAHRFGDGSAVAQFIASSHRPLHQGVLAGSRAAPAVGRSLLLVAPKTSPPLRAG